jgi:hypothetical protein
MKLPEIGQIYLNIYIFGASVCVKISIERRTEYFCQK